MLDYEKIGKRIRKYRKSTGLSQEELAEKIWISATHMSHIETGSTKLSLPVLVDIASALNVSTDSLLFDDSEISNDSLIMKVDNLLVGSSKEEIMLFSDIIQRIKRFKDKES